MFVIIVIL